MASDLNTIRERIRALRAKAKDAACTEAEAQAAADLAAKLMIRHDIEEAALGTAFMPEGVIVDGPKTRQGKLHLVYRNTGKAIAALTETKVWTHDKRDVFFAGMPADVDFAIYLCEMLATAADRGWMTAYINRPMDMPSSWSIGREQFRDGFYQGFAERVGERLKELAAARAAQRTTATGCDIVASKTGLIAAHMRDIGLSLHKVKYREATGTDHGRAAGYGAGGSVGLGRPVGHHHTGTRQIGA